MFFYKKIVIVEIIVLAIVAINYIVQEKKYNSFNYEVETTGTAKVVSSKEEKEYKNKYIVECDNKKFFLYTNKNVELQYGDLLRFNGHFEKVNSSRNFGLFDYSRYLKQYNIYGVLKIVELNKIGEEKDGFYYLEILRGRLKQNLFDVFDKEEAGFLAGLLIGDKSEVLDETKQNFQDSSLSHILAISGMHIIYVSLGAKLVLDRITNREKMKNILMICFLVFFAIFTGGSPSCLRACIMCSILILSQIFYKQYNFYTALIISLDITLLINPYNIESIGMWLSYLAVFGIFYFKSCNLMIIPVVCQTFNKLSLTFFISNFIVSKVIGPIIILGYIHLFLGKFSSFFAIFEKALLYFIFKVAEFFGGLWISKIPFPSINVYFWICYYILILGGVYFYRNREIFNKLKKAIVYCITTMFIIGIIILIPREKDLEIHFLDVGQGDSCLIITPERKTILIDGGNNEGFDNGKNIVYPYLLKNGFTSVDYMIISHFDSDHVGGLIYVLENLEVKNIIYDANKGDRINIEKDLYIDILWPDKNNLIKENMANNNSIVCKLNYKDFSILFTGDIEEIAESKILQEYKGQEEILNSTVLKVAHHGSKTSSNEKFLEVINPKIALIGVGKNNAFGHPNYEVLDKLNDLRNSSLQDGFEW